MSNSGNGVRQQRVNYIGLPVPLHSRVFGSGGVGRVDKWAGRNIGGDSAANPVGELIPGSRNSDFSPRRRDLRPFRMDSRGCPQGRRLD
jgi:hypothetical protein